MHAILTNLGSLGDVQPLISLAFALQLRGHRATLLAAPQFQDNIEQLGFGFRPLGFDLDYRSLQRRDTESELNGDDHLDMHKRSLRLMQPMLPLMLRQTTEACRQADILIAGHLQPTARMVHEMSSIPYVTVHINHFGGMQPRPFREAACAVINPLRTQYGLEGLTDPIHSDAHSPQLALHAVSRYLRPPSAALPPHHHVTGFFFWEDPGWRPDEALLKFIDEGEKPVVISFSSMVHADPAAITQIVLQAVRRVGCRTVIQSGWSGLGKNVTLPPEVYAAGFVPHTWLFAHSACTVHAGGAGVTGAALRSGVPSVVVPHQVDQPLFGELMRSIGCAKSVIPIRELTETSLATALEDTLADVQLHENAQRFAKKIRAEDGLDQACTLIERALRDLGIFL